MTEKQALARVASYCSKGERCEFDVKSKLLAYELNEEEIARILLFLRKENFLNEERFCKSFIKDKIRFNKWGMNKIIFELKKKNIPEYLINDSLKEVPMDEFEESLIKLLKTKIKSLKANSEYDKRIKLYRFAAGRGFSSDMIQRCLNNLLKGDNTDEHFF